MCQTPSPLSKELKQDLEPHKRFRLADIYQKYFSDYVTSEDRSLTLQDKHFEAVDSAISCRTSRLGICQIVCESCGDVKEIKRSCKHRFCGRCGSWATKKWAANTLNKLMNIPHHHIVMTLPMPFRKLSQMNGDILHNCLFQAAAQVIQNWFKGRFGMQVGIVSVLHTAGSDLKYHPHVHMLVSRGGKLYRNGQFKSLKGKYLCPQRQLGIRLKEIFTHKLSSLYQEGKIKVYKKINSSKEFNLWMENIKAKHWIVSIQQALQDVVQIVQYVGRYTKRACLSELKLVKIDDQIHFKYNDYKNSQRGKKPIVAIKVMSPVEFLDKLLQHVPNKGFKMVRYYGIYNSFHINKIPQQWKLALTKQEAEIKLKMEALKQAEKLIDQNCPYAQWRKAMFLTTGKDPFFCYHCHKVRVLFAVVYHTKTIILYEQDTS